ncbi:MAG: UDP-N-acetylglucosamine 2-epimerase (non-hydrolyzing) [Spirochaetales bacterium]|nr:UDP-N-acetylglucosamine 2-epimerase (non-hydrolyzing) [Spirochaetales bacterium]
MKTILTVIGARPQFVKAAVLSRLIRHKYSKEFKEILVHTGQHYDKNMSDIFFKEMEIPEPDYNLNIGSGSHGMMTGKMLEAIEGLLLEHRPDYLLVYGDTNSTLAGALAASKLHIPVIHVEAGLRSFNMHMPEEQNRIVADHLSTHLLCPTETAISNLKKEGLTKGVENIGDIMLDASLFYRKKLEHSMSFLPEEIRNMDDFFLITLHRAENTDDKERLTSIVSALNSLEAYTGVLPLHPRTKKMLSKWGLYFKDHIKVIAPVGYLDMIRLESSCNFILTDSGGVQKEAYFFGKPCITMRNQTEWVETIEAGCNILTGADQNKILSAINNFSKQKFEYPSLYGKGDTGERILKLLL